MTSSTDLANTIVMDNPAPTDPVQKQHAPPEEKLLHARTFLENYGKYFPLIPPLFLIIVLAGVYFVVNNTATPSQTPQPIAPTQSIPTSPLTPTSIEDPTKNWKTFTNTDYGYQLKYPEALITITPENAPQVFIIYFTDKKEEYLEVEIGGISSLGLNKEIEFDTQRTNPTKTTFQNKQAVSLLSERNIYPGEPFKALIVYLEDKKFKIELGYYGDGKNEALFDQILSTFKFLDQTTDISDWKSFTANGYSFKYPSDWKVAISDYLNTVSITNAASTVEIKISDSNYPFGQSGPVEATSKFIQLEVFDTMYTVEETTINNSNVYVGFKTDTIPPLYLIFGTGYPASGQESLKDYEDSKSTILKILSTFKFTQ